MIINLLIGFKSSLWFLKKKGFLFIIPQALILKKEFEDTKGVIRICNSKDQQYNGQKKKDNQRSTKHMHKTKDRVTRTPLKTGGELNFVLCLVVVDIILYY